METYTFLRELADSWVLLAMTGFYLTAIFWAFRPSAKAAHKEMSELPLRDDDAPKSCNGSCAACKSKTLKMELSREQ